MKVIVLGAGLVGGPMAIDLANDDNFEVTVADICTDSLSRFDVHKNISTICRNFTFYIR